MTFFYNQSAYDNVFILLVDSMQRQSMKECHCPSANLEPQLNPSMFINLMMHAGTVLSIPLSELLGRKLVLLMSNMMAVVGYVPIYMAPDFTLLFIGHR